MLPTEFNKHHVSNTQNLATFCLQIVGRQCDTTVTPYVLPSWITWNDAALPEKIIEETIGQD